MTPETFARYASRNLPRYTSYPTSPHFSEAVGARRYEDWLRAIEPGTELSLYLHIPFCRSMCWYCGCHTTVTRRQEPISAYLAALLGEMRMVAAALRGGCRVRHLHFGGGTPNLLRPEDFESLSDKLGRHFRLASDAEIAVEVDPRLLDPLMAAALARGGVNRASFGIQSFDPEVQRAINRVQSFDLVEAATERLRSAGIAALNFDLVYGLPRQTVGSCLDTVERAVRLAPDRFAVFGYAHVPAFKPHQRKIDAQDLPGVADRCEQAAVIDGALAQAGYIRVGLDHYARPSDDLALAARTGALHRNFQGYTTDACPTLIGLGASAIGRLDQGLVQNAVAIPEYRRRIAGGVLPTARGYALTADDRLRAGLIERLMCDLEVDVAAAGFPGYAAALAGGDTLETLEGDGLIERDGTVIRVTDAARPLVRAVAAAFDAHLPRKPAVHSRTV